MCKGALAHKQKQKEITKEKKEYFSYSIDSGWQRSRTLGDYDLISLF
jgi:hypothetical protein